MTWQLTWRGRTFTEDDVTGADLFAAQVCMPALGWAAVDPLEGPAQATNLFAALAARIDGRDFDEVVAEISTAPAVELAKLVRRVSPTTGGSEGGPGPAPSPPRSPRAPSTPPRSSTASPSGLEGPGTTPEPSLPEAVEVARAVA